MKFKVIALLGATSLLAACAPHHPEPKHDCHFMGVDGVPAPRPLSDKHRGDVTPPPPCHGDMRHDGAHHPRGDNAPGTHHEGPGQRPAPGSVRHAATPDTGVNDNYPFWR